MIKNNSMKIPTEKIDYKYNLKPIQDSLSGYDWNNKSSIAIIVLGYKIPKSGDLPIIAKNRIYAAAKVLLKCTEFIPSNKITITFCGGKGKGDIYTEADIMFQYFQSIYENLVTSAGQTYYHHILETNSTNTFENAINLKILFNDMLYFPNVIILITSDFHMIRAGLIFNSIFSGTKIINIPADSGYIDKQLPYYKQNYVISGKTFFNWLDIEYKAIKNINNNLYGINISTDIINKALRKLEIYKKYGYSLDK